MPRLCNTFSRLASLFVACVAACAPAAEAPLRVGAGPLPATEPLFWARDLGELPPSRIHLAELYSPASALNALRAGSLDAAVLPISDLLRLAQRGSPARAVAVLAMGEGEPQLLVVRRDLLAAARPAIELLLRGWYAALARQEQSPAAAAAAMAPRLHLSPKDFEAANLRVRHPSAAAGVLHLEPGSELKLAAEKAEQHLIASHELRAPLELADLLDAAPLREVAR